MHDGDTLKKKMRKTLKALESAAAGVPEFQEDVDAIKSAMEEANEAAKRLKAAVEAAKEKHG